MGQQLLLRGRRTAASLLSLLLLGSSYMVAGDTRRGGAEGDDRARIEVAPDTATALAAARRQQSPVLVAELTTETRVVHARPDGVLAAELSAVPVREQRDGRWADLDHRPRPEATSPAGAAADTRQAAGAKSPAGRETADVGTLAAPRELAKNAWGGVYSGNADQEYYNTTADPGGMAQVGRCNWSNCSAIVGVARTYFRFDTRFLAGKIHIRSFVNTVAVYRPDCGVHNHHLYFVHGQYGSGTNWGNQPGHQIVNTQAVKGNRAGCTDPGNHHFGFSTGGHVRFGDYTSYFIGAADEANSMAWRKYDPAQTRLYIEYNTRPNPPTELSVTPWRAVCKNCAGKVYLGDDLITLKARLTDPDGDAMRPYWTVNGSGFYGGAIGSGGIASTSLNTVGKHGTAYSWSVAAVDAHWSATVNGPSFVVDRNKPVNAPTVDGDTYPADNSWHGGAGVPGRFTFTPAYADGEERDIDHYLFGWDSGVTQKIDAPALGEPVSTVLTPPGDGPQDLYVHAVDRAGHRSPPAIHHFYVRSGNGPLAQWSFEGDVRDSAYLGDHDGTLAGGATFGSGAVGTAVTLDSATRDHVEAPHVLNTKASFSVSAWVKLSSTTGARAIVSQDGQRFSGFALWHRVDSGGTSRWVLGMANSDGAYAGTDMAWSSHEALAGVWTHVAGVYDAEAGKLRVYVNGERSGEADRTGVPWNATGGVQIGRTMWDGSPGVDHVSGAIDEVALYDRVLSDAEIRSAVHRDNVQVGHWRFEEPNGATAANEVSGGDAGVLTGGAAFTADGLVDGSVRLDGGSGAVTTAGPQLRTDRSFTVAAWVELERQIPESDAATVVSQDGTQRSGFALQYVPSIGSADSGRWRLVLPAQDIPEGQGGSTTVLTGSPVAAVGVRAHVAAVYDAGSGQITLYVDGVRAGGMTRGGGFHATGPFVIGRGQVNGQSTDYFPGLVDEVRAYSRPLSQDEIQGLMSQNNVTEGQWKLDGGLSDASGNGRNAEQAEEISFAGGQTSSPDPADLALSLNGSGYVHAPKAIRTDTSFSVSAWARLDRIGGWPVIVSQDGAFVSAFQLQASPSGYWSFVLFSEDSADGGFHHRLVGPDVQLGTWTHLVGIYDAPARRLDLYVNGVLAASGSGPDMWNHPTGRLIVGAAKWNGQRSDRFPGAIDDVAVYNRVLFAEEIRTQAGRDLSLVHNWTLDEPSGGYAGDSVGSRAGTLTGGYTRVVGRSGNALRFGGGAVTTPEVDLRTDESFTVTAWVSMDSVECLDPSGVCYRDAVTVAGDQDNKFRLGHLTDGGDNFFGSWVFEMPEPDGSVTKAAVSTMPGEVGRWVHLVGVYDEPSKTIWLYVDAVRQNDGTLNTAWQASGGVSIGRGLAGGEAAAHFPGMIDDVRLYTGVLDKQRVAALLASYPAEAATAPLPTDEIAYWKLDDMTGTTGADASGNGHTVTMTGGTGWIGGRRHGAMKLDGTTAFAQTAGPVIDTGASFSVAAWTYLEGTEHNRTLVAQDGNRVSAFYLQYHQATGKWAVLVPTADTDNPQVLTLTSAQAAPVSDWTHLAVTYEANLGQLKLYVNGVLSVMRAGVDIIASSGPLTLGRAKWNGDPVDYYRYCIDDVRVFDRVLSAGEVRAIHDDVYPANMGQYTFDDDTPSDSSWRGNDATPHTSGVSYGPGLSGRAIVLDGTSGRAVTSWLGVSTRDSFTVSAWAKLDHKNQVATVVSQGGHRGSSFFLQYRPGPDRWVFGAHEQDADAAGVVYAQSLHAPAAGVWTHLTGVYDYAGRQLRLYVDGQLVGTKEGIALWIGNGPFAIGRGKVSGQPADFFPGSVDHVTVYSGIREADDIAAMGWSGAPAGHLGSFVNLAGDHYTGSTSEEIRPGYRYEAALGSLVSGDRPNTRTLYACLAGGDGFTSTDPACEGAEVVGEVGQVYAQQPTNVATIPVYRCAEGGDRFESRRSDCAGATLLGYTLAYASLGRHRISGDHWQGLDAAPYGYTYEGPLGFVPLTSQPGTVPLIMCTDGPDQFLSTDGTCGGDTVVGVIAEIFAAEPSGVDSKALYSCSVDGQRFADFSPTCAGYTVEGVLGYVLRGAPNPQPVFS